MIDGTKNPVLFMNVIHQGLLLQVAFN